MNLAAIILEIDRAIDKLQQARTLLTENDAKRGRGRPRVVVPIPTIAIDPKPRRKMSRAGRARIAAAQKARWARLKGLKK